MLAFTRVLFEAPLQRQLLTPAQLAALNNGQAAINQQGVYSEVNPAIGMQIQYPGQYGVVPNAMPAAQLMATNQGILQQPHVVPPTVVANQIPQTVPIANPVTPVGTTTVRTAPAAAAQVVKKVTPKAASTVTKKIGNSDNYQSAMTKSFNQFKAENGRLPKVAGTGQTGKINIADQKKIDTLHKQYMKAGMPSAPPVKTPQPVQHQIAQPVTPVQPVTNTVAKVAKQNDLSGTQAAGIALKKGAQATGEAAGSFGKKAMEFAGEHPGVAGAVAGVAGALGLRKILNRNKNQ